LSRARFRELTINDTTGEYRVRGLQAISWNPLVRREERLEFERQALLRGVDNFQITELDAENRQVTSAEKDRYVTVLYIEPNEANKSAVGFDINSEPVRREAIDIALQLNAPATTAPIELVQGSAGLNSKGALVLWPVRTNSPLIDMERGVIGFVAAVVNFGSLLGEAGNNLIAEANVVITDVTDLGSPVTLYSNARDPAVEHDRVPYAIQNIARSTEIEAQGRRYRVAAAPSDAFLTANLSPIPNTLLSVALLLTFASSLLYFQWLRTTYAREESHYRLSRIMDSAHEAIIIIDSKGFVTEWNAAAVGMFGYEMQFAIGRRLSDLIIPAQFIAKHNLAMQTLSTHSPHSPHFESHVINKVSVITARRANGELFPVELSVRAVLLRGGLEYVGLIRDISERQRSEAILRESQKLEAIGQLTGGLAHDFNNLLGIVIGNLEHLANLKLEPDKDQSINNALDAALRASMVTTSLMAVARRQNLEIATLDINAEITGLLPLIESTLGKRIDLTLRLAEGHLLARLDHSGFSNAIINLAINGRDAVNNSLQRCLTIETKLEVVEAAAFDLTPGKYAVIKVTDTGCGMTPDILARALEPFYTTKQRGLGTGLGLSMVYGFARQLLGTVRIESKVALGTTVSIYLPTTQGAQQFPQPQDPTLSGSAYGNNAAQALRILVVEDELFLRKLTCRLLTDFGHIVIEAESADVAATILDDQEFDVLFTDIAMPGKLDGVALANLVTEKYPNKKIVVTTGFLDEASRSALRSNWEILNKPYRRETLKAVLQSLSRSRDF
jgi:PAS domain S-box-containing protein